MSGWLSQHYIEIIGAVMSIMYLVLSIRQHILLWPLGILSAALYMVVFFTSKLYAQMGLNAYYLVISIYGWIVWATARKKTGNALAVCHIRRFQIVYLTLIFIAGTLLIMLLLSDMTDSPVPFWDALIFTGSALATWMLTRKILEHWLVWIVIDGIAILLYVTRELYPTALLFVVYTAMAVVGFRQWRKEMIKSDPDEQEKYNYHGT